nr:MAG TPA: hypothetical protein [Caudoviricetes sp.]
MDLYSKEKSHLSSLHLCITPEMALSSLCYIFALARFVLGSFCLLSFTAFL